MKKRSQIQLGALALAGLVITAGAIFQIPSAQADDLLNVDVACDANTFAFQGPTVEGGGPGYGASFVVQGVIYPEGTLAERVLIAACWPMATPSFRSW